MGSLFSRRGHDSHAVGQGSLACCTARSGFRGSKGINLKLTDRQVKAFPSCPFKLKLKARVTNVKGQTQTYSITMAHWQRLDSSSSSSTGHWQPLSGPGPPGSEPAARGHWLRST